LIRTKKSVFRKGETDFFYIYLLLLNDRVDRGEIATLNITVKRQRNKKVAVSPSHPMNWYAYRRCVRR